jgi:hypothetical protein
LLAIVVAGCLFIAGCGPSGGGDANKSAEERGKANTQSAMEMKKAMDASKKGMPAGQTPKR